MKRLIAAAASLFTLVACLDAQTPFDSAKAWSHLQAMVNIGPRPAGSAELRQTRAYITRQLSAAGLKVADLLATASTV